MQKFANYLCIFIPYPFLNICIKFVLSMIAKEFNLPEMYLKNN